MTEQHDKDRKEFEESADEVIVTVISTEAPDYNNPLIKWCAENGYVPMVEMTKKEFREIYGE